MAQANQVFAAASAGGTRPTQRNPMMTIGLPFGCFLGGIVVDVVFSVLGMVTHVGAIAALGGLIALVAFVAGAYFAIISIIKMVTEVKSVTNNQAFAWWPMIIPFYNWYWMALLVPQEVANAKRAVGAQEPVRSPVLYFFLFLFALASDINDIAARSR
jgi:uncharacterized membrane protein